jgi:type I restriction enzyme M protein
MKDPRFVIDFDGDPEYSLVTRTSDGQLMFLANKLAKMKTTGQGSRIAEVHNGSSLFTGDAGQGESNIRRWIIESDWLEAIIALPNNMFYNTGIATYIWVISNRKAEQRRGKVQLIDATKRFTPLRKNLGSKNAELGHSNIVSILDEFMAFEETATSKIFPNAAFGYWKVTVDRPLKLRVDIPEEVAPVIPSEVEGSLPIETPWPAAPAFDALPEPIRAAILAVANELGTHTIDDWSVFSASFERIAKKRGVKLTAAIRKQVQNAIATRDDSAQPVDKKRTYDVVEYEPDPELRDTEQISLLEDGGIEGFFAREVLSHVPDAWIVPGSAKIGYEVSFTRYFYKPKQLRTLAEIEADIRALEAETEGLLEQILVEIGN